MVQSADEAADKLKVFISYSRKDEAFASELVAGLEATGFGPYLDRQDIAAGEDWESRLGSLIEAADTVVFVISPDSIVSTHCLWEVDRSEALSKRLFPIVWRDVDETKVPTFLRRLNYIHFEKPHSFGPSLAALVTALNTELAWVREHTRLGELAARWDARSRAEALLLRGEDIASAKSWVQHQPKYAREPTLLQREFIAKSEEAEISRANAERRRLEEMAAALQAVEREQAATARFQRRSAWALRGVAGLLVVGALVVGPQLLELALLQIQIGLAHRSPGALASACVPAQLPPSCRDVEVRAAGDAVMLWGAEASALKQWKNDIIAHQGRRYLSWSSAACRKLDCYPVGVGYLESFARKCSVAAFPCERISPDQQSIAAEVDPSTLECRDGMLVPGDTSFFISDARLDAINSWEEQVRQRHGEPYARWTHAASKSVMCGQGGTGLLGELVKSCAVRARPCRSRE